MGDIPANQAEVTRNVLQDLRARRSRTGKPQQDIADALGVSRATLAKWETGETAISLENFLIYCDAVHTDPAELLVSRGAGYATRRAAKREVDAQSGELRRILREELDAVFHSVRLTTAPPGGWGS